MNAVMEQIYPDKGFLQRRKAREMPRQLFPCTEVFTAYLHEEMRQTYLNGHDYAAIAAACALIEFAIKDAIHFSMFVEAGCVFEASRWNEVDRLEFGKAINLAKTRGIVTKDEHKKLDWIREHIRNVYMHGETPPSLKEKDFDGLVEGNLSTGEVKKRTVKLRNNLTIQRFIRLIQDRNTCEMVIPVVDRLVRKLNNYCLELLKDWRAKHTTKPTVKEVDKIMQAMQKAGFDAGFIITGEFPDELSSHPG